jgi:protein TonB
LTAGGAYRASALVLSAAIHAGLAAAVAGVLLLDRGSGGPETAPFEVIENPVPALSPLRPIPQAAPKPAQKPEREAPRQVFGVRKDSARDENSPVDVKSGNTTAKAPDQLKLRPEDEASLPIPVDEYLVSRMPQLVKEVRVYPPEARKKGIQGSTILDLLIDPEGRVGRAEVVRSSGSPELDQAAAEAARQFVFRPAETEGKPVAVKIRYAYRFVIEK